MKKGGSFTGKKKIINLLHIKKLLLKLKNKKTVLVGGCFDIFHYGHLFFLERAKKAGDYLIIALESDKHILIKKNREPVHTQNQRAKILASLEFVDFVIKLPYLKSQEDYDVLVNTIKPSIIVLTKGDTQLKNKTMQAKMVKAKLIIMNLLKIYSSNKIINYASILSN